MYCLIGVQHRRRCSVFIQAEVAAIHPVPVSVTTIMRGHRANLQKWDSKHQSFADLTLDPHP